MVGVIRSVSMGKYVTIKLDKPQANLKDSVCV